MSNLVFDTNACDRLAGSPQRKKVMKHLKRRYRICASINTLYELIHGLCGTDSDPHLELDKRKVKIALGTSKPSQATFLDHGLIFALEQGPNIYADEFGKGESWFRPYAEIVLGARSHNQMKKTGVGPDGLLLDCAVIKEQFANIHRVYAIEFGRHLPDKITWAKEKGAIVNLTLTDTEAERLAAVLDAAYQYDVWLNNQACGTFDPSHERHRGDRMDMHQLYYLADATLELITCDRRLRDRTKGSPQASRIVLLGELLEREGFAADAA